MQVGQVALRSKSKVGLPFFNAESITAIELFPAEFETPGCVETGVCWLNFGITIRAAIIITAIAIPAFIVLFTSLHILR
jgi:hypothetical protein